MSYAERLSPPPLLLAVLAAVGGSFGLIFVPLSPAIAGLLAVGLAALVIAVLFATAPSIVVSDGELRAGDARIPARFLGDVEHLDAARLRDAMRTDADVRAYVVHLPWAPGAVKVSLSDPRDPTPYWLITSRHPEELAAAVRSLTPQD